MKSIFHSIILNQTPLCILPFYFVKIFYFGEIPSKNGWNLKPSNLKTIKIQKSLQRANNYMPKDHNRNTRTRWRISLKLTIETPERRHWPRSDVVIVNFTYFTRYCRVSLYCWLWAGKCLLGTSVMNLHLPWSRTIWNCGIWDSRRLKFERV